MRKKKGVTMQDIADELGISKVTVSKALNDKDGVGPELKERIVSLARQRGYKAPRSGLRSRDQDADSYNIAIILDERYTEGAANFYLRFYKKLSMELNSHGYLANLIAIDQRFQDRADLEKLFHKNKISGVILLGYMNEEMIREVKSFDLPCVLVDMHDPDFELDCVVIENIYCTYELTNHLIDMGHTDIGFVGSIYVTRSIQDRYLGYCRALLEHGKKIRDEWILHDRNEKNEVVEFELPDPMPSAFVCNCDDTAYRFVNCLKEHGYRVPQDISVVSFDNDIFAEICDPKLTTVEVDIDSMAKRAVRIIIEKMEREDARRRGIVMVKGKIVYRDSVAACMNNLGNRIKNYAEPGLGTE